MHSSAMKLGKRFFETYLTADREISVADIGAQNVNGSLRDVAPPNVRYTGVDFVPGRGVDVILEDPYHLPFDDNTFDAVVCSSVFEHSQFFWELFLEIIRILKPGGLCYLNVPSNGYFHQYPSDNWRFYPDAGLALQAWGERQGSNVVVMESFIAEKNDPEEPEGLWNDFVGVFLKDGQLAHLYPQRIMDTFSEYTNGYRFNAPEDFDPKVRLESHDFVLIDALRERAAEQRAQLSQLEHSVSSLEATLTAMLHSRSWKATRPLRYLERRAGQLKRRIKPWFARLASIKSPAGIYHLITERQLRRRMVKSGLFDSNYYLSTYPDVARAGVQPLDHYLTEGWKEGRNPSASFSTIGYQLLHEDVDRQPIDPLTHFVRHGHREGRAIQSTTGEKLYIPYEKSLWELCLTAMRVARDKPALIGSFFREWHQRGFAYAWNLVITRSRAASAVIESQQVTSLKERILYDKFKIVPYYLNPFAKFEKGASTKRVAVHLHLYYQDMADSCLVYLNNIPYAFDLFVSVPEGLDPQEIKDKATQQLAGAGGIVVEQVPNRGRDIAPFIIQFGDRLRAYDYVAHIHTKKSPRNTALAGWFDAIMSQLLGSQSRIAQIFKLLDDDGKVVYPAGRYTEAWDDTGWSDNRDIAATLLGRMSRFDMADFPYVEFPQGFMFWAKTSAIADFLTLPIGYEAFPEEPLAHDATVAHALERILLICTTRSEGRNYRLESPELSAVPTEFYEDQQNFAESIVHPSIKVLAYYLPQFHPTPENDEWHGVGFTEWHKVRAANPLFQGHYQQHVPHPDIGYYQLNGPEILEKQAGLMRQAGVHGLIFYHYWFSGRLILEKPAQMLLANPQIQMPFSFCWANENWTRRWDGNEQDVLLGQVYSPEDAKAFIEYLIPFFKDPRYIKVEGRPVLFVYRPSAVVHCAEYIRIWQETCIAHGLKAPYVVATLTRGATAPQDYGMDAAVERVLNDWTAGAVRELKGELRPYQPINGSVLSYPEVANHYMNKIRNENFMQFRSLVPVWDNTPRYGSEAYALHGFSPKVMQQWLEHIIRYSVNVLPEDRRFVVVNAWNEWAEGAHIEPDQRYGYAYLNGIGRALSGQRFDDYVSTIVPSGLRLQLELSPEALKRLETEPENARKFKACLNDAVNQLGAELVANPTLHSKLEAIGITTSALHTNTTTQGVLVFKDLFVFSAESIQTLVKMASRYKGFAISASLLNEPGYVHDKTAVNYQIAWWQRAGLELRLGAAHHGYKVCYRAVCFKLLSDDKNDSLQKVSVITRFHHGADRALLQNALLSLVAQNGCSIKPWLALQDVAQEALAELKSMVLAMPWAPGCEPEFLVFHSKSDQPDMRATMLNETLKKVVKGFVAFLDYDDVVYPDAYAPVIGRLQHLGKNASFGRVNSAYIDFETGMIIKRDQVYHKGSSYEDYLRRNLAPLHSFVINLDLIDTQALRYLPWMKYMEDYYLTLQIFSKNKTDWDSLKLCHVMGDYVHRSGDASHTLAFSTELQKVDLMKTIDYQLCEDAVVAMRQSVIKQ